jgi:hypothetical protein
MNNYFLSLLILPLLFLSGCGVTIGPVGGIDTIPVEEQDQSVPTYLGVWERLGTYVEGTLVGKEPAELTLNESDFYSESAACWVSGDLVVGEEMVMTITDGDCPVVPGAETIAYTHSFSEDGNDMTIVTVYAGTEVMEKYERAAEETEEE